MENEYDNEQEFDEFDYEEGQRPFPEVLTALFQNDEDEETAVPLYLLHRLTDMDPEESAELFARWPRVTPERRRVIARHMADIAEDNFVVDYTPAFAFFLQDDYAPVRIAALDGLWDATDLSLVDPIINLMHNDPSMEVRAAAAAALAHYVLMSEWGELPEDVSPRVVEELLRAYRDPEASLALRRAALESMSSVTEERISKEIEEAYESDLPEMQLSALFAMGNSADQRWLPLVLDEMLNPAPEMRAEAARAAGAIGSSDAVPRLAELTLDEELDVALTAVAALGQIGNDYSTEILVRLGDDPELEHLHDAVEDALEEISWLGGQFDMLSLSEDDLGIDDDFGYLN